MSIASDGTAALHVSVTVDNAGPDPVQRNINVVLAPSSFSGPAQVIPTIAVTAPPGKTTIERDIVGAPCTPLVELGQGTSNLYELRAVIKSQDKAIEAERNVRIGIRTVTRDADMAYRREWAEALCEGIMVFQSKASIAQKPLPRTMSGILRLAIHGNFNMLVNFTVVEKPSFYDLCDRLGILVVEELPFAQFGSAGRCSTKAIRGGNLFWTQARMQVTQIVTAQRNHPSIIEWAPLAEAHDKANGDRWGINNLQPDQAGYDTFIAQMREIVSKLAPTAIFHPSLCDLGEQHFWMAEAGARYIHSNYQEHFDASSGFVSEYGSISMPSFENSDKYISPKQQWDPQRSTKGRWFGLPIDTTAYSAWSSFFSDGLYSMLYRSVHFIDSNPRSARELVQDTQLYQAFLLKYAAEAYRRKKYDPINGIRNWDFVELAPGSRFGIIDFDRVPKVAYWYLKQAQAPVAISFAYREALESQLAGAAWSASLWIINDFNHPVTGVIRAKLLTLAGEVVSSAEFPVSVPADGKALAGTFAVTLPERAGVYVLRASLTSNDVVPSSVEETSFIKVVPKEFEGSHRVLLLAQKKFAGPIRKIIEALGLTVDLYDEDTIDRMAAELKDAAVIRARYDVIWLGSFEALAKVLPPVTATAIVNAVRAGSGFIHTGGPGSFHGGQGHSAIVEATDVEQLLPVQISGHEDTSFGPHSMDDTYDSQPYIHDITASSQELEGKGMSESLALLRQYGALGFNRVQSRAGASNLLSINGQPLLTVGTFGQGRTVAFMGFTPNANDDSASDRSISSRVAWSESLLRDVL